MSYISTVSKAIATVKEITFQHANGYHISDNDKKAYQLALSVLKDLGDKL